MDIRFIFASSSMVSVFRMFCCTLSLKSVLKLLKSGLFCRNYKYRWSILCDFVFQKRVKRNGNFNTCHSNKISFSNSSISFWSVILEVFVTIYFVAFGSIKTIEKMGKYEKASVETLNLAAQELHGMIAQEVVATH